MRERAFQTRETARAKALRQEHKLGRLLEHTAGDTAGVQSVPSTLYSPHPLTSELEDPSDTQSPAMKDVEGLGGRGLPIATRGPCPSGSSWKLSHLEREEPTWAPDPQLGRTWRLLEASPEPSLGSWPAPRQEGPGWAQALGVPPDHSARSRCPRTTPPDQGAPGPLRPIKMPPDHSSRSRCPLTTPPDQGAT